MTASKATAAKAETKPKAAAPKAAAAKTEKKTEAKAAAKPAVKVETKKAPAPRAAADGKIKVTQLVGTIARKWDQEATLKGLGLNKRHRSRVLENTPEVRGMVYKVRHLVSVEKVS